MAEFCGFVVDRKVPDGQCFSFVANGLFYGVTGDSATARPVVQWLCQKETTDG